MFITSTAVEISWMVFSFCKVIGSLLLQPTRGTGLPILGICVTWEYVRDSWVISLAPFLPLRSPASVPLCKLLVAPGHSHPDAAVS